MQIISDDASMARILDSPIDGKLKHLLSLRAAQLSIDFELDLADLARFIIVEPGDRIEDIETAAGLPILVNFVDGGRYGTFDFTPSFEWVLDHGGWYELPFILSDDGFGTVLLVPDLEGVEPHLLGLCREYVSRDEGIVVTAESERPRERQK